MTEPALSPDDTVRAIRSLPRDTTLAVEGNARLAESLFDAGYHVVLVGAESKRVLTVPSPAALNENWSLVTCRNPAVAGIGGPALREVISTASERAQVNASTSNFRARGWAEHFIRNLRRLTNPLAMTLRGLDGVPAFIVGAGSSLDLNHHLLPEASRRGIVIAVNAAARMPGVDMALTVESNDLRHKLGPLDHVSLRAFGTTADPNVMDHGSGALTPIYAGEMGDLMASLCGAPKLACSALGGTAAVALAERLGCDPIVLVGHDFEAIDGGLVYPECLGLGTSRTHVENGAIRYEWDPQLRKQKRHNPLNEREVLFSVPSATGGTTTTTGALHGASRWYAQVAQSLQEHGDPTRLINASERGAALEGWEAWTLRETIDALPPCEYVVTGSPGATAEQINEWIAAHLRGIDHLERCARRHDIRGVMGALRQAPLVEPWVQAQVSEVMARRRSEATDPNPWREWRAAKGHEADVLAVLLAGLPDLVSELEKACC